MPPSEDRLGTDQDLLDMPAIRIVSYRDRPAAELDPDDPTFAQPKRPTRAPLEARRVQSKEEIIRSLGLPDDEFRVWVCDDCLGGTDVELKIAPEGLGPHLVCVHVLERVRERS